MKIIDAHFHLFDRGAEPKAGTILKELYGPLEICGGVVMGNEPLSEAAYRYEKPLHYCVGIGDFERSIEPDSRTLALLEQQLRRDTCAGLKFYIGYAPVYAGDERLAPYYRLAQKYHKPVAFHTGMTAGSMGQLKYCHPLTIDEVAARYPEVQFVLCHFGNPFLADAAAVMEKNPNVAADLSGLLEGVTDLGRYFERQAGYVEQLRTWMRYVDDDSRFLFGTDYPAVDVCNYVEFISRLVDPESRDKIFFDNANRIYGLGL